MVLARWQRTIVDEEGSILPGASVEVRGETPGAPLASLFSDRAGATPIGNPFTADLTTALAAFHVVGGAYRIRVTHGSFEAIYRYVGIATGSEVDFGIQFVPSGSWDNATTYDASNLVEHNGFLFSSINDGNLNHEPDDTPASDAFWMWIPAGVGPAGPPGSSTVVGTSASSVAIGTGSKTFTIVENDRGWGVGSRLRIASDASPNTHYMEGVVTSYSINTLQVLVDAINGSGSRSDWTISVIGQPGSSSLNSRTVTAAGAVTVAVDDEIILLNKTSGAATNVNFPAAASYTGRGISIKDVKGDAETNNITPVFNGAETCDGLPGTDFVINWNYGDQGVFRPSPNGGWYLHRR